MLFLTNVNYFLLKFDLIKKKTILLTSFFIFITCNNLVLACNVDNFFSHRKNVLSTLNAPNNSLLQFQNESPLLLVEDIADLKSQTFGSEKLSVSILNKDGPIWKDTLYITTFINLKEELSKLNIDKDETLIISSNKIFIFKNSASDTNMKCSSKIVYFIKQKNNSYQYIRNNNNITLNQNIILNLLLKNPKILNNLTNDFNILINASSKNSSIPAINELLHQNNGYADQIKLTNVENGAQLSEAIISVGSYKTAKSLKDGNALHYLSKFKVSKEPKLVKVKPEYTIGLKSQKQSTNLKLSRSLPINKNLKINIVGILNDRPNLTEVYLSNKRLIGKNNQFLVRVGKMSKEDLGLLFSNQSFNLQKESVIRISGYSALNRNCTSCIQNAITSGVEKYFPWLNLRIGSNYLIQNFQNKTEHLTEISFKKKFNLKESITFTFRHDLSTNHLSEFGIIYQIPLGVRRSGLKETKTGFFEYSSNTASRITNWTSEQNDLVFNNTPNHLKRNWNNYISFD